MVLSEKLKVETLANHQDLEKVLVSRMRAIRNIDDYLMLLKLFYSYFGALENLISSLVDPKQLPDYAARRKAALIASDILTLDGKLPELVNSDELPLIRNADQALGALYVIEGSTLGGQIIEKMILKQLNLPPDIAILFFSGYGDQTQEMWSEFKATLNRLDLDKDEVIGAANETFLKFAELFYGQKRL